ncbi:MAG: phosphatidate cytidylyltransferase [Eubacterium sp.]|nr:phosphatidate cytidylyltransferase [Eubacterium sp.]
MKKRVITAFALLALLIVVVWQVYTPLLVFVVSFFAAVSANEIMKCAKISNKYLIIVGTAAAFLIPFFSTATALEPLVKTNEWFRVINAVPKVIIIAVLVLSYFLAMLKGYKHTKFEDVAITVVASIFVPWCYSLFVLLRDIIGYKNQLGVYLIFYALITALVTDIGAQLGGMKFGKTQMSPNISPKKTVEGACCGILLGYFATVVAFLLYNRFALIPIPWKQAAVLLGVAPVIQFIGMMGDLTASVLKRNFDVKDFGNIFPGHGGVMDRFDSTLFTIVLTYCTAIIIY